MIIIPLVILLIIIFYIFLILPRMADRPDMSLLKCDYAHRGLHGNGIPENSLAAFAAATEAGFGSELDVTLTADGIAVIFHDDSLLRMCGVDDKISNLTYEELSQLRLLNTDEKIPTLEEVLSIVDSRYPLLVEIKGSDVKDMTVCKKTFELLDNYNGLYCVESFNPYYLKWIRKNRPHCARGQLFSNIMKSKHSIFRKIMLSFLFQNVISRPDFIAFNKNREKALAVRLCRSVFKVPCFAWTIKSHENFSQLRASGNNVIFEGFIPDIKE